MLKTKFIFLATTIILMSGCSTLELAISDEFKYGKIYAMQTALVEAVDSCEDQDKVGNALYWARVGMSDLPEYMRYMGNVPGVAEQGQSLSQSLRELTRGNRDASTVCETLKQASLASQQFTVALSGRSSMMVAMNN